MSKNDRQPAIMDMTPDSLARLKGIPFLARQALRVALKIEAGSLTIELPDGRRLLFAGPAPGLQATLIVRDYGLVRTVLTRGHLGAAQAFLEGRWDSPDMTAFLEFFAVNKNVFYDKLVGSGAARLIDRLGHWRRRNSRRGAQRNIEYHYDLGNTFYRRWLDPTMTYSSARFAHPGQDLSAAQLNKYRTLAERIELKPEHELLEIGSGWGGFAEFAAREIGCRVTGITISQEQLVFARERIARAGLSDRVDICFQDYRDVERQFDRIASIEMFEAVGEENWPAFFSKVRDSLRPGGIAGLQIITIDDAAFNAYRKSVDFIQRYIFPGGMLPSPSILKDQVARAGLDWAGNLNFGLDYAETLAQWRQRFAKAWPDIQGMGFDERFRRMWDYYLAYCEAGFRTGNIDVTQVTLTRS